MASTDRRRPVGFPWRACRLLILALLSLAAAGGLAAGPPPAPVEGPAAMPGLAPLPSALASRMGELTRATERWRGLAFRREVTSGALGSEELRRWIEREVARELPPARLAELESTLEGFGFIPTDLDLARFLPDLMTEQMGGFYDTERELLVLVRDAAGRAAGGEEGQGDPLAALTGRMEEAVLVHELTHALQDQVFGLPDTGGGLFSDREAARDALVEGDATLTMLDFMLGQRLEEQPLAGELLGSFGAMDSMLAGVPGSERLAAAPPYFRETLLFSYAQGLAFCAEVRRVGGQRLLDHAFAADPPRSTEQVLHPEKWHARRDDPVDLAWPDFGAELPGWTRLAEGELGELAIGILLRGAPGTEPKAGGAAAAGWGGDRFAVYGKGAARLLLWLTEWDAPAEAEELAAAAAKLGAGWTVERQAPTRVALVRGELTVPLRKAVLARLAAVPTVRPANRSIDLPALGIERPGMAVEEPSPQ